MSTIGSVIDESTESSFGAVYIKDSRKRRKCPLCQQNLHLYNLNYEEMMLMCENLDCDYPFGYEALQVVSHESELIDKPVPATNEFYMYPVNNLPYNPDTLSSSSMVTSSMLSEIDQPDFVTSNLSELAEDTFSVRLKKVTKLTQKRRDKAREIENRVKNIKVLNDVMVSLDNKWTAKQIKKEKWLNNLKSWENTSGKKLLTADEAKSMKKDEYSLGDIKIGVDANAKPLVNIEICKKEENLAENYDEP